MLFGATIFLVASTLVAPPVTKGAADSADIVLPSAVRPLLEAHCVDCHDGPRGKGGLDLAPVLRTNRIAEAPLRALRKRLSKRDMPPADEAVRPTLTEYSAAVADIDALIAPTAREVPNVRRLNRAQYVGAIDAVLQVASVVEIARGLLPPDEIGEGFDTTGDTLALPALLIEKYFDVAEAVAAACVPDDKPLRTVVAAEKFDRRGQGGLRDGFAWLATNGTLSAEVRISRSGRHRVSIDVMAQQAGNELARVGVVIDDRMLAEHVIDEEGTKEPRIAGVPEPDSAPTRIVWEGDLTPGVRRIGARFLNDFWAPNAENPKRRDRNLGVGSITVEGPLDPATPTLFESRARDVAGEGVDITRLRRCAAVFGEELFGRQLTKDESNALAATAREAAGRKSQWRLQLRWLITALLVDPRFLLRVEAPAAIGVQRTLTGDEIASRLSYFLWSSVPDGELRRAAREGELSDPHALATQARRMLSDARRTSLSQRFAVQWLGIDALETKSIDPTLFPGVDIALLTSMRRETELLFDEIVAGRIPVRGLLESRTSRVDGRLARHYAITVDPPMSDEFIKIAVPAERAGGVLGHASVLVATSNPTRTSPVKRGKWVLDALLDQAPPPPPPGVPQLPETIDASAGLSIRALMEQHRANPDCASCHVQMDALGLAFERIDVDGRPRTVLDGAPIDDRTELPDGRMLNGIVGIEEFLATSGEFERSLARRLLVYALGRGTADADDKLIDALATELRASGSFVGLVEGIVRSEAFRTRTDFVISPRP